MRKQKREIEIITTRWDYVSIKEFKQNWTPIWKNFHCPSTLHCQKTSIYYIDIQCVHFETKCKQIYKFSDSVYFNIYYISIKYKYTSSLRSLLKLQSFLFEKAKHFMLKTSGNYFFIFQRRPYLVDSILYRYWKICGGVSIRNSRPP